MHVMDTLDASPVTSSHVRQWTAKDPTLAKVRDSLVSGNCPREDIIKPYYVAGLSYQLSKDVSLEELEFSFLL